MERALKHMNNSGIYKKIQNKAREILFSSHGSKILKLIIHMKWKFPRIYVLPA